MNTMDNLKIEKSLISYALTKGFPLNATFELLPICNFSCGMCFLRLPHREVQRMGGLRTVEEWLAIARELQKMGTMFILLTGGEPFLYKDFKKLYKGLRELGMILRINTNGALIDEDMADFLAKDRPRRMNITLYGASEDTYEKICGSRDGFGKTVRAIRLLRERGIDVELNGTIVPGNVHEIERIAELARELDVPIGMETYIVPGQRERIGNYDQSQRLSAEEAAQAFGRVKRAQDAEKFEAFSKECLEIYEKVAQIDGPIGSDCMECQGGRCSAWINWQGRMQPCIFMNHISRDVLVYGVKEAWEYILKETEKIRLPKECVTCKKRPVCGVCAGNSFCETGRTDGKPEYLCRYMDAIYDIIKN